jgi:hypothetical protein
MSQFAATSAFTFVLRRVLRTEALLLATLTYTQSSRTSRVSHYSEIEVLLPLQFPTSVASDLRLSTPQTQQRVASIFRFVIAQVGSAELQVSPLTSAPAMVGLCVPGAVTFL